MSGTLYVVATPIGNLEDITLRALRILREVDLIAAEDTRRTAKLLAAYSIATPMTSFHAHNAGARLPGLLHRLREGRRVALVTDAGTPGVSDPGVELVRACVDAGLDVDCVPGPTAPIAAATVSGFPLSSLTVLGFPPVKTMARTEFWCSIAASPGTVCFFEAPHRILRTLGELGQYLGDRQICVAREITKVHQEFLRGPASEVIRCLDRARGEFTLVVGPTSARHEQVDYATDDQLASQFGLTTIRSPSVSRRRRIAAFAKSIGRPTGDVYAALERAKRGPRDQ
jgi:16S rRNA (cytidine1402-2'-O)-methyltransferase